MPLGGWRRRGAAPGRPPPPPLALLPSRLTRPPLLGFRAHSAPCGAPLQRHATPPSLPPSLPPSQLIPSHICRACGGAPSAACCRLHPILGLPPITCLRRACCCPPTSQARSLAHACLQQADRLASATISCVTIRLFVNQWKPKQGGREIKRNGRRQQAGVVWERVRRGPSACSLGEGAKGMGRQGRRGVYDVSATACRHNRSRAPTRQRPVGGSVGWCGWCGALVGESGWCASRGSGARRQRQLAMAACSLALGGQLQGMECSGGEWECVSESCELMATVTQGMVRNNRVHNNSSKQAGRWEEGVGERGGWSSPLRPQRRASPTCRTAGRSWCRPRASWWQSPTRLHGGPGANGRAGGWWADGCAGACDEGGLKCANTPAPTHATGGVRRCSRSTTAQHRIPPAEPPLLPCCPLTVGVLRVLPHLQQADEKMRGAQGTLRCNRQPSSPPLPACPAASPALLRLPSPCLRALQAPAPHRQLPPSARQPSPCPPDPPLPA